MAWTAEKTKKSKVKENVVVDVVLRNGGEVETMQVFAADLTEAMVADRVAAKIATLAARDAAFEAISIGPIVPAKIEVSAYDAAYRELKRLEGRIEDKIDEPGNEQYLSALALVKQLDAAQVAEIKAD